MDRVLAVESVCKRFGRRQVLQSAGMWATAGRIGVLLGRNGAGKTTLFKITVGLLRADEGIVIYGGERDLRPNLGWLARAGLLYLPSEGLFSNRHTLRRHFDALRHRFPEAQVESAIQALGIGHMLDRKAHTMSGGERRRTDVALALSRSPRCLLADEPFHSVAPKDMEVLSKAFRRLADTGCAIVLTGHEVKPLLAVADDVYWMTAGTTHLIGSPAEARQHHQFQRGYLSWRA